jgi:hypothetical protein
VSSNPETQPTTQIIERQVPVTVSGRGVGAETGEAFTEQTVTTAISEKGGVIRLGAEVNEGQTIRVRNGENGREAAARVLKRQTGEDGSRLAELEFVEAESGFWAPESVADDPQASKAAEESVEMPKLEPLTASDPAPKVDVPTPGQAAGQAEETPVPDWMKVNKAWEGGDSYPIRMQLPKAVGEASVRTAEFAADSATITAAQDEYLLPKPSLDFEQFPGLAEEKTRLFSGTARRSLSGPIGVLAVAVSLLVATGIGAFRLGWLRWPSGKVETKTTEPVAHTEHTTGVKTSGEYAVPIPVPKTEKKVETLPPAVAPSAHEGAGDGGNIEAAKSEEPRPTGIKHTSAPVDKNRKAVKADSNPPPGTSQEGTYEPPKLVKAIRALSPPEALQAFVSGVVLLDALVDENGKVVSATPISGPKALYEKATQTVKEGYLYLPATRNGKPVQAHVQVRIQFWYEP